MHFSTYYTQKLYTINNDLLEKRIIYTLNTYFPHSQKNGSFISSAFASMYLMKTIIVIIKRTKNKS